MAGPIDYGIQQPDITAALTGGLQQGMALRDTLDGREAARAKAEQDAKNKAAMEKDIGELTAREAPATALEIARFNLKYPDHAAKFKEGFSKMTEAAKQNQIGQVSEVYGAMEAGDFELAEGIIAQQVAAAENSGDTGGAKAGNIMLEVLRKNPEAAKNSTGMTLAGMMGEDNFIGTFTGMAEESRKRKLDPSKQSKAQAEAETAATEAKFAESNAVLELQKKGVDISKVQEDEQVSKANRQVANLTKIKDKTMDTLKQQELQLKIDEKVEERDTKARELVASGEATYTLLDNSLNTIDRLLASPELDDVIGSFEGGMFGNILPSDGEADAIALIETIQSQQFLDNLMMAKDRGATFGALSEQEGAKLQGYLQNLSRKQSEKQFKENLVNLQTLLKKSRERTEQKTGVKAGIPDTPDVLKNVTDEQAEAIARKWLDGNS